MFSDSDIMFWLHINSGESDGYVLRKAIAITRSLSQQAQDFLSTWSHSHSASWKLTVDDDGEKDNEALKIQDLPQIKVTAELHAYDPS